MFGADTLELIKLVSQYGLGGVGLGMIYLIQSKQQADHREDRKEDTKLRREDSENWRKDIVIQNEKSDKVIEELTKVLKEKRDSKS